MVSDVRKRAVEPWLALAFCACLSLIAVAAIIWLSFSNGSDVGGWGWAIPFLGFLPMCFFFVGSATSRMQAEIMELRRQVAELQANKPAAG